MPVGPLGGIVLPGLHDEGLVSHSAQALTDDRDLARTTSSAASVVCGGLGSRAVQGPEGMPMTISGVTRDDNGVALGGCVVRMFALGGGGVGDTGDVEVGYTTSDGSGNFSLPYAYPEYTYFLVAYKAGSPDVAGTTANTLVGS